MLKNLCFSIVFLLLGSRAVRGTGARTCVMQLPLQMGFEGNVQKANVLHHNKTVVCMLDSWSHWRKQVPESSFEIPFIDASLCTQIVYRSAQIDKATFRIKFEDNHLAKGWLRKIVGLRTKFPHLKVLLSVGGWAEGGSRFSQIAADFKKREVFVESVLRMLQEYKFDGMDLAWEYPTWITRGGKPDDKTNLPVLLNQLREQFGQRYLLTLTAAGARGMADSAYDIKAVSKFVDQFNIRAFDFAGGGWSNKAYHHAPLIDTKDKQSVEGTVNFYLERGAPPEKLVVGVPFYGWAFLLKEDPAAGNSENETIDVMKLSGLEQPSSGGFNGKWISDSSLIGYHELCKNITASESEWTTFYDNRCNVPFARSGRRWVSFDNPESIEAKVNFMMSKGLKGMGVWSIDTDDFRGTACKRGEDDPILTFPLLRTVNKAIVLVQEELDKMQQPDGPIGRADTDKTGEDNVIMPEAKSGTAVNSVLITLVGFSLYFICVYLTYLDLFYSIN